MQPKAVMIARNVAVALGSLAFVIASAACGDAGEGSLYGDRFPDRKGSGSGGGDGNDDSIAGDGDTTSGGDMAACATTTARADQLPLHMVVVLDKSGSMCEYTAQQQPRNCNDPSSKWQQVAKALSGFFSSPTSKGITVSLIAFPLANDTCNPSTYQTPLAADVVLPDTTNQLSSAIAKLSGNGSTPTRPALEGAIAYAKNLEAKLAGKGKVAVLMATDGYPQDCPNNTIESAAAVASSAKATIPTYVVGVGSLLTALDRLAQGGGTNKAFIVSTQNQGTVGQDFAAALSQIRGASLACEYALPAPPAGQTLDLQKVNVQYTPGNGAAQTLAHDAACTGGDGWKYDNAQAPTKIQLCPAACDRAKADTSAKLDVVLGCQTVGTTVK